MSRTSLDDWLHYQQQVHPRDIELGLERVHAVWRALGSPPAAPAVITVGGTNGKGSTVAFLDAMLAAMGKRVGCFTSPHLLRYNERVRVAGADVADAALLDAFERIEQARGPIPLTYFEFGTLAALWIFSQSELDAAVLEVGLGGRLDAVNIVDADVAIVTTVDLDHQDWLGADRDSIGREKAGIFRAGRPAIVGMRDPPQALMHEAQRLGANVLRAGEAFQARSHANGWRWECAGTVMELPLPALQAPGQIDNAAAALTALHVLRDRLGWNAQALALGIRTAHVAARLQQFAKPGAPDLVIDVGHNPQAARALAGWLAAQPSQPTIAVFGALSDKDVDGIAAPLLPLISHWHLASLHADTPRGLQAAQLQARTVHFARDVTLHASVADALDAAALSACNARILAFGSFFVAAPALVWAAQSGYSAAPR
jgi:dihydrofolate synthase/folylpolyglutamate synthase